VKLYFVRHATAAGKVTWHEDDDLRPLTRAGRKRFQTAAEALVSAGVLRPQLIITSPLVRAVQTAELLTAALPDKVATIEDARLGHDFSISALHDLLAEHRGKRSIAIVGHNPSFADVLSQVVDQANLDVRKGAIALVDIPRPSVPSGCLLWLAPPSLFRPCG
jgi:phosphohistidine phosphatase